MRRFGKTILAEGDLRQVCAADPRITMGLQQVGGERWTFEFDSADELRNEMKGLAYAVPRCLAEATAYAKGSLSFIPAQNLTQVTVRCRLHLRPKLACMQTVCQTRSSNSMGQIASCAVY